MTDPESLVAAEGVDEGSADSTAEGTGTSAPDSGAGDGLLGEPPRGAPEDETQAAGPVDMESAQSREERGRAPGQQLSEGEG